MSVCVRERDCVRVCERETVCVCVRERLCACVRACVPVCERERREEREREIVNKTLLTWLECTYFSLRPDG